jgi:hypothetical protein
MSDAKIVGFASNDHLALLEVLLRYARPWDGESTEGDFHGIRAHERNP